MTNNSHETQHTSRQKLEERVVQFLTRIISNRDTCFETKQPKRERESMSF